jgi:ADP-heptose:LPS heptosyltransferase
MIYFSNLFIRPFKNKEIQNLRNDFYSNKIKKVVINRSDAIGDAVVSYRFIEALAKIFPKTYVLASKNNIHILKNIKKASFLIKKEIHFFPTPIHKVFYSHIYMFTKFIFEKLQFFSSRKIRKFKYDLLIDLSGEVFILKYFRPKYSITPNVFLLSFFYTYFYKWNLSASKKQLIDAYKDIVNDSLALELNISDSPPSNFKEKKTDQIFVFVGCKSKRNLPYEKWKSILLRLSQLKKKIVVADDPDQLIIKRLCNDTEILSNNFIQIIIGKKTLSYLANIANNSKILISLDGGGEHYLERYTNSIIIYTCGLPYQWKPYSLNPYVKLKLPKEHILEKTVTSSGLYKCVLYRFDNRKPCFDLVCDFKGYKEIDENILFEIANDILNIKK